MMSLYYNGYNEITIILICRKIVTKILDLMSTAVATWSNKVLKLIIKKQMPQLLYRDTHMTGSLHTSEQPPTPIKGY